MPNGDSNHGYTTGTESLLRFDFNASSSTSTELRGSWTPVQTLGTTPGARTDHTGQYYMDSNTGNGQFLVYGGRRVDSSTSKLAYNDIWSLDLSTMTWTPIDAGNDKDGPFSRFLHGSTLMDDGKSLVVFGGLTYFSGSLYQLSDIWVFDLINKTWKEQVMETALLRSALPMMSMTSNATTSTLYAFAGVSDK